MNKLKNMIETNIANYVEYSHFLLPYMLKLQAGQFIYLSSFRAVHTSKGTSLYSASKAFGEKFFEILGKEYGSKGVFSTSIRMGYFDGKMLSDLDEKISNELIYNIANRKLGSSEDLNKTIEYVIQNNYTNASIIELTGGIIYN